MKNNKGITLVALVITIIVLLILAGVSISMVVGENGVLNRAKDATDKTAIAQAKEALETAISGYQGDAAVITKISTKGYEDTTTGSFYNDITDANIKLTDGYTVSFGTNQNDVSGVDYKIATVNKDSKKISDFYIVRSGAIGAVVQDNKPAAKAGAGG